MTNNININMTPFEAVFAAFAFISSQDIVEGIIAGKYANDGDFSYSVVILRDGDVLCGGVLVTVNHVFTSCHCVGKFGRIEDVTDISWEPLETGYTFPSVDTDGSKGYERIVEDRPIFDVNDGEDGNLRLEVSNPENVTQELPSLNATQEPTQNSSQYGSKGYERIVEDRPIFNVNDGEDDNLRSEVTVSNPENVTQELLSLNETQEPTQNSSQFNTTTFTFFPSPNETQVPNNITETTIRNTTNSTSTTPKNDREITSKRTTIMTTTTPIDVKNNTKEGFIPFELNNILLVAGTIWIYRFGKGQVRSPRTSYQHPSCYNDTVPWEFDYGVYVCKKFHVHEFLAPMTLWHHDRVILTKRFDEMINDGEICTTVGWGATLGPDEKGMWNNSEKLKYTDVKLVTDTLCNELLCRHHISFCLNLNFRWSDRGIVCASHLSHGDSCNGDDGNALVCHDHVVGFTNSGVGCLTNIPRFYTRLDYATDFYYSTVSSSTCKTASYAITAITHIIHMKIIKRESNVSYSFW